MTDLNALIDLQAIKINKGMVIITWIEAMELDRRERITRQQIVQLRHRLDMALSEAMDLEASRLRVIRVAWLRQEDTDRREEVCHLMLRDLVLDLCDPGLHLRKRPRNGGTRIPERRSQSTRSLQLKLRRIKDAIEDHRRSRRLSQRHQYTERIESENWQREKRPSLVKKESWA